MRYLGSYNNFKTHEGWLSDKLEKSSDGIKNALSNFTNNFNDVITKIKSEWNEDIDVNEVSKYLVDTLKKSFSTIPDSIDKMDNIDDVEQLYDNIDQSLVQFNDSLSKEINNLNVSESIRTYNNYLIYNEAQKSIIAGLISIIDSVITQAKNLLNENREEYIKIFETDEDSTEDKGLDSTKEEAKVFLKKLSKTIESNINGLDIKKISDEAKAKVETDTSKYKGNKEYKPGTILKYTKKDGDDNDAEVSNNQENVEDGYINMISTDGKDKFVINTERIIGEADEDVDIEVTTNDITNRLEDIKGDSKKMNKLKKFIDNELK